MSSGRHIIRAQAPEVTKVCVPPPVPPAHIHATERVGPPGPPGPPGDGAASWAIGVSPTLLPNGSRTEFPTPHPFAVGSTAVRVCGIDLIRGLHYTEHESGGAVVLTETLLTGDLISITYQIEEE